MALTERKFVDKIEIITETKIVQVRTANVIEKDGVEIARTFERKLLRPTDDITNEEVIVQTIANAVWTAEVIAAYQASLVRE
jgi:hypothetical protein